MKRWYANPAVIIIAITSVVAMLMAGLVLLLLPGSGEIIRLAQWRTARLKTAAVNAEIGYQGTVAAKTEQLGAVPRREMMTLSLDTRLDRRNPKEPRTGSDFALTVGEGDAASSYQGRALRIGPARYVRFSSLPAMLGNLPLANLGSRWLSYDPDAVRAKIPLPVIGGASAKPDEKADAELLARMRSTPFLAFESRLGNDRIGGVAVLHYKVRPEILFIKDFVIRSEEVRINRELDDKERRLIDAFFANIAADEGEVWIGRSDYFFYRMRLRFRYDDGERRGNFSFSASLSQFNKPMTVAAPDSPADDIDRVIASLLPGLTKHLPLAGAGTARRGTAAAAGTGLQVSTPGGTAEADRDHDGLPDVLEVFYGTDSNNPDTDGDGMTDGAEVDAGRNPSGPGQLFDFTNSR
ncbi:MAG: thrombospondin type 3 repeat-containing protein [Patescibacteria group bacterium]